MITCIDNYNLKERNTFGMDVSCRQWVEYTSRHDLPEVFSCGFARRYKSIGAGSNLLFRNDYPGALLYNKITDIEIKGPQDDYVSLRVGGGVIMDDLVRLTVERGLWGIENLSGIPGTVGAAAVQNIGAYGVEMCDAVHSVEAYDTCDCTFRVFSNDECGYAYRRSIFKTTHRDRHVVTHVNLLLSRVPAPRLDYARLHSLVNDHDDQAAIRRAIIDMRDSKLPDPRRYGNAGSFFMNPVVDRDKYHRICGMYPGEEVPRYDAPGGIKIPAAWLIDRAGWRGRHVGGAAVWDRQPLVLVNRDGNATPQDIIDLKDAIILDIDKKFGITLTPEVEII